MASGPQGRKVTVRAIAAQTGVSIATVSRVLNDQTNVAPETRELVRRAAEQLSAQAAGPRPTARPRCSRPTAARYCRRA